MKNRIERKLLTFYNEDGTLEGQYEITKMGAQYWRVYTDRSMVPWIKFMEIDGTENLKRLGGLRWTFGVKVETLH